ncbi:uncharacterized protein [Lepeophtheirus salmonis]|uniref:uncharacterized protein n=1 Tax=Lepeophtheirus salmonis TaxID=72036 RepID=UPI001AE663DD|nr:uncharacterized protein LOC121116026 [Lepeophtheirus salmonis]
MWDNGINRFWNGKTRMFAALFLLVSFIGTSHQTRSSNKLVDLPFWSMFFNNHQDVDRRSWRGSSLGSEFLGKRSTHEPGLILPESGLNWEAEYPHKRKGEMFPGSEFIGKRLPGSEFIGKRFPGSEFIGKRLPGSEFIGKRRPGSEFIGKRVPGSEFIGKRSFDSDGYVNKRLPGSEFIGKRGGRDSTESDMIFQKRIPGSEFIGKRLAFPSSASLDGGYEKGSKEYPTEIQSDRNKSFKSINYKLLKNLSV